MSIQEIQICKITIWCSPVGDMFETKTDEILKSYQLFGTADDILIVCMTDGTDHDATLQEH